MINYLLLLKILETLHNISIICFWMLGAGTFFLTSFAAECFWTEIISVVAQQYGKTLTDEEVNNMDWSTKGKYLKRDPVRLQEKLITFPDKY